MPSVLVLLQFPFRPLEFSRTLHSARANQLPGGRNALLLHLKERSS